MSEGPYEDASLDEPAMVQPRRELPALAERVMIIGLDGATFYVLNPMIEAGRMPNLKRLIDEGASGVLESTKPPITPAAWTTFMTGKGPGRHGIVDFEKYDAHTNSLNFNSTFEIQEKTIWEILSEKGFRVGSINVPMTYPPKKVNGFVISGFETPNIDVEFTYPSQLKQQILDRWPDYTYRTNWQRKVFGGSRLFAQNLEYISQSFDQGYELARFCGERYDWHVLMVLLKLVDNLQHKAWKYLDPKSASRNPTRAHLAAGCFERLDAAIGQLVDYARSKNATVLVISDHGHGSLDGKAQPNLLLKRWGYLTLRGTLSQARTRGSYIVERIVRRKNGRFANPCGIEHDLAIDWSRTRACVMHGGIYGCLYINLAGRQPEGIVSLQAYEVLRDELRARLLAARCNGDNGKDSPIFEEVHKTEELYGCSRDENPWLPDLLLVPAAGLAVVRKIRGFSPVRWCRSHRMEGTHRVDGILVACGPHVSSAQRVNAGIADIAPTVLAALGLRVPIDMEGQVIAAMFETPPVVEFEPPQARERVLPEEEVYTEEEKRILAERLTDLGYLD